MNDGPRMSIVLVTDRYETIRGVVQLLARQTVADQLEVILVASSSARLEADAADVAPFHGHRVVEVADIMPLGLSRAEGVRATTAPVVTVGETHALPRADWAAEILAAFDAGRSVVVPGITNGNPDGAISWSNLMADYGRWSRAQSAGENGGAPNYNTSFGRDVIDGVGDRLDDLYSPAFDAPRVVREQGRTIWLEPRAVLYHVNVSRPSTWPRERFLSGRVQAAWRARSWSRARRLVYIAASPLIVPVTLRRVWPGYRAARRGEHMPRLTLACLVVGAVFKTAGEVMGFAFGATEAHERAVDELELHKVRYTRHGVRGLVVDDA